MYRSSGPKASPDEWAKFWTWDARGMSTRRVLRYDLDGSKKQELVFERTRAAPTTSSKPGQGWAGDEDSEWEDIPLEDGGVSYVEEEELGEEVEVVELSPDDFEWSDADHEVLDGNTSTVRQWRPRRSESYDEIAAKIDRGFHTRQVLQVRENRQERREVRNSTTLLQRSKTLDEEIKEILGKDAPKRASSNLTTVRKAQPATKAEDAGAKARAAEKLRAKAAREEAAQAKKDKADKAAKKAAAEKAKAEKAAAAAAKKAAAQKAKEEKAAAAAAKKLEAAKAKQTVASGPSIPIIDLEGVGPKYEKILAKEGITESHQLLDADLDALAKKTDINLKRLTSWRNMSELLAVKGIGPQFSEVLERSGIHSVKELAAAKPKELHEQINTYLDSLDQTVVGVKIGPARVKGWITNARKL